MLHLCVTQGLHKRGKKEPSLLFTGESSLPLKRSTAVAVQLQRSLNDTAGAHDEGATRLGKPPVVRAPWRAVSASGSPSRIFAGTNVDLRHPSLGLT